MSIYLVYFSAVFFALAPALLWLTFWYRKDKIEPEPKKLIIKAFLFGVMGIMPFLGMRYALENSSALLEIWDLFAAKTFYLSVVLITVFAAFLEESVKHFAAMRLGKSLKIEFNQIVDGIIYSVSAALGFAFAENVIYFINALFFVGISPDFWSVFAFRSLGTMLGHTIFSGIFGFFWGYAFLSLSITPRHTLSVTYFWHRLTETLRFHIIISHILRGRPSGHGHEKRELVTEALLLATIVHTLFNLLIKSEFLGQSLTFLVVPILLGGLLWLSKIFLEKKNVKIWENPL